jgi:hypothetical protein
MYKLTHQGRHHVRNNHISFINPFSRRWITSLGIQQRMGLWAKWYYWTFIGDISSTCFNRQDTFWVLDEILLGNKPYQVNINCKQHIAGNLFVAYS